MILLTELENAARTGCKTVAIDEKGDLLDDAVIYPTPPRNDIEGAHKTLKRMIDRFGLNAVAIGNGTASRETEFTSTPTAFTQLITV